MVFSVDKIDELFPFPEFRKFQKEIAVDIVNAFNQGTEVYLLNGPVGFGKSPLGILMGRMTSEKGIGGPEAPFGCYYTTPQKMLQDQLVKDFSQYINVIKGRSSYGCNVMSGNTCKDGMCQFDDNYECDEQCSYKTARDNAVNGQIACSNFSYMMVVPSFLFGERELLIVDETHSVANWALDYVSCIIYTNKINQRIPVFNMFSDYIKWLGDVYKRIDVDYKELCVKCEESASSGDFALGLKEARDTLKMVLDKIGFLVNDYANNGEEWVWQIHDSGTRKERIQFQPITAGRFLQDLIWWRGQHKILMSGTIYPELFMEEAGLTDKVCEYKEVPSIFPVENRPIYYWPVGKMTLQERENTLPKLIDRTEIIVNRYPEDKGFMHCGSYAVANEIYDGLYPIFGDKIWIQDRQRRDESFKEWLEYDEPTFFLSVNRTEGVDLKDELCRYQIVGKVQFPYLGDKRIRARMDMKKYRCTECSHVYRTTKDMNGNKCACGGLLIIDMTIYTFSCSDCGRKVMSGISGNIKSNVCTCGGTMTKSSTVIDGRYWYDAQAIIDLNQSYGRPVRTPTDFADMWILDSSFYPLYKKRYTVFPKLFKEAVKLVKGNDLSGL